MTPREISEDDLDEVEFATGSDKAEIFIEWATDRERFTIVPPLTPSELLLIAADHLEQRSEWDRAWETAESAVDAEGGSPFCAHEQFISQLVSRGEFDRAREFATELRMSGAFDASTAERVGEAFEDAQNWAEAQRWHVMAMRKLEADGEAGSFRHALAATARYRARRSAGLPLDMLDTEAIELREVLGLPSIDWMDDGSRVPPHLTGLG